MTEIDINNVRVNIMSNRISKKTNNIIERLRVNGIPVVINRLKKIAWNNPYEILELAVALGLSNIALTLQLQKYKMIYNDFPTPPKSWVMCVVFLLFVIVSMTVVSVILDWKLWRTKCMFVSCSIYMILWAISLKLLVEGYTSVLLTLTSQSFGYYVLASGWSYVRIKKDIIRLESIKTGDERVSKLNCPDIYI